MARPCRRRAGPAQPRCTPRRRLRPAARGSTGRGRGHRWPPRPGRRRAVAAVARARRAARQGEGAAWTSLGPPFGGAAERLTASALDGNYVTEHNSFMLIQYRPTGRNASEIARDVETAVREGRIAAGVALPPVRGLAAALGLSPVTVAAAYRELREKGIARGNGRAGSHITPAPPIGPRPPLAVPDGVRDLMVGSPDPALLPRLPSVTPPPRPYGDPPAPPRLGRVAAERFRSDGIDPAHLAVVGGALDGVERVLGAWLRQGDRVAVEDPGYPPAADLLGAMDLRAAPMPMDEFGVLPDALRGALARGCQAVLLTPRAQAPTGAAWDRARARELAEVLASRPDVLVIEDDHAGPVSGATAYSVVGGAQRWATIRSASKSLGPDLRLAVLAGDAVTVSRVEGRQALGTGWVSFLLQETVAELWQDAAVGRLMERAATAYAEL